MRCYAQGHCEVYVLVTFREFIMSTSDVSVAAVLTQLFQLHATYSIMSRAADFTEVRHCSEMPRFNFGKDFRSQLLPITSINVTYCYYALCYCYCCHCLYLHLFIILYC